MPAPTWRSGVTTAPGGHLAPAAEDRPGGGDEPRDEPGPVDRVAETRASPATTVAASSTRVATKPTAAEVGEVVRLLRGQRPRCFGSRSSAAACRTAARRLVTCSLRKMLRLWVRMVFSDTCSSRAMPGPSRSVASSRRTSSSRSESCSTRPVGLSAGGDGAEAAAEELPRVGRTRLLPDQRPQQRRGRGRLGGEHADVPLRLGPHDGAPQPGQRLRGVPRGGVRDGQQRLDLDQGAVAPARLGGRGEPQQQAGGVLEVRPAGLVPGEEDAGEGHVLVLADVRQLVRGGEALAARPLRRLRQLAAAQPQPCPDGGHRLDVRGVVAAVDPVGLVQLIERGVQVAAGLVEVGAQDPGPVGVLRQTQVLAEPIGRGEPWAAPATSPRSSSTPAMPTCMSAEPRSGVSLFTSSASEYARRASPSRPCVRHRSPSVMARPRTSARCPARRSPRVDSV